MVGQLDKEPTASAPICLALAPQFHFPTFGIALQNEVQRAIHPTGWLVSELVRNKQNQGLTKRSASYSWLSQWLVEG